MGVFDGARDPFHPKSRKKRVTFAPTAYSSTVAPDPTCLRGTMIRFQRQSRCLEQHGGCYSAWRYRGSVHLTEAPEPRLFFTHAARGNVMKTQPTPRHIALHHRCTSAGRPAQNFDPNSKFSPQPKIFALTQNFRPNLKCSPKPKIFT